MSSLLPLTASFIILLFLYSSGSYPSNKQATTATPADKGLLRTTELNAHLSPHIYNVFNTPKLEITTSDACVEQAKQFCTEPLHTGLVTYAESSTQWTVCHCDSQDAWSYLVNHLSRLPLALRTHIHTIMLAPLPPSTSSPHAHFTRSPPTATFFGHPTIGTWVHEFAHAVDVHHSTVLFSSSAYWTTALEKDSCVVDAYARTSREEALAQAAIVKSYLAGRPTDLTVYHSQAIGDLNPANIYEDPLLGDYSCMKHQLIALECLDAFHTEGGCPNLDDTVSLTEEKVPPDASWLELWLATNLIIILLMLAQL